MGYACPVCESLQADGEHLANHVAFTAMLHGGAHEAWLDERVPDWADRDPDGLAAAVVEHAEETDHGAAFDAASGDRPDGEFDHARHRGETAHSHQERRELDPEARRIVEEAVEMTRRRRTDAGRSDGEEE